MKRHVHNFEAVTHRGVTDEAMENGIQSAEIRKCSKCNHEAIYLMNKKGKWFPLFEEEESNERDILLA